MPTDMVSPQSVDVDSVSAPDEISRTLSIVTRTILGGEVDVSILLGKKHKELVALILSTKQEDGGWRWDGILEEKIFSKLQHIYPDAVRSYPILTL